MGGTAIGAGVAGALCAAPGADMNAKLKATVVTRNASGATRLRGAGRELDKVYLGESTVGADRYIEQAITPFLGNLFIVSYCFRPGISVS
jgi:hypothetical protein